jgi:PPOX class probable F420-dependent enzyme
MAEIPASHRDLLDTCQVVTLATNGPDGYPQVSAVWFTHEPDGTVKMSLHPDRQKTKNLLHHPECSLFFLDPANPYRTLEIRARADLKPDPNYAYATKVDARYGGNLQGLDKPGDIRYEVTFAPVKVNTFGS